MNTTHKLNHTGNCAVSTDRHWMVVTDTAPPAGAKCNLLTRFGVAIIGCVTEQSRPDFAGWEPLARIPDGMLDGHPAPMLRGGKSKYVNQYEVRHD